MTLAFFNTKAGFPNTDTAPSITKLIAAQLEKWVLMIMTIVEAINMAVGVAAIA
jgi:hypothetical protein